MAGKQKRYIYAFQGASDGDVPASSLVADSTGNLYATTELGGSGCPYPGCGTAFEIAPNGIETVLHSFAGGSDGAAPESALVIDSAGHLYGTTSEGGGSSGCAGGCGVVFQLQRGITGWTEKILYSFCSLSNCNDGATPMAGLATDSAGNLYGTTYYGGKGTNCANGCGVVFELSNNGGKWTETILYSFCGCSQNGGIDGAYPHAPLLLVSSFGSFYLLGTTEFGGNSTTICYSAAYGCGTVFVMSNASGAWTETQLYAFCPTASTGNCNGDGWGPLGGLLTDPYGDLIGTTSHGGNTSCCVPGGPGTMFEIQAYSGQYRVIHNFCQIANCGDGEQPEGQLTTDGTNVYGTTLYGGLCNYCGTLFRVGPDGAETIVHSFCSSLKNICEDGDQPYGGALLLNGYLYGSAGDGGVQNDNCPTGCGLVFQYTSKKRK